MSWLTFSAVIGSVIFLMITVFQVGRSVGEVKIQNEAAARYFGSFLPNGRFTWNRPAPLDTSRKYADAFLDPTTDPGYCVPRGGSSTSPQANPCSIDRGRIALYLRDGRRYYDCWFDASQPMHWASASLPPSTIEQDHYYAGFRYTPIYCKPLAEFDKTHLPG
jgi:hypothetical protein